MSKPYIRNAGWRKEKTCIQTDNKTETEIEGELHEGNKCRNKFMETWRLSSVTKLKFLFKQKEESNYKASKIPFACLIYKSVLQLKVGLLI